jgi:hypothetical protein
VKGRALNRTSGGLSCIRFVLDARALKEADNADSVAQRVIFRGIECATKCAQRPVPLIEFPCVAANSGL